VIIRPGEGNTSSKPRMEKSAKPVGCKKLFAGNLSYNIDDEAMIDFFKDCGSLVGLRWLTHKGTEEFRGCGFMEFGTEEEAEAAMKLDGKEVLGR
jgi:nucleolin